MQNPVAERVTSHTAISEKFIRPGPEARMKVASEQTSAFDLLGKGIWVQGLGDVRNALHPITTHVAYM
jgi:hypothetical protein